MDTETLQQTAISDELDERLAAIESSLGRIEAALAPIVAFFETVKQHPMLRGMLG